jgi:pilus assembly protein Flp/PilA
MMTMLNATTSTVASAVVWAKVRLGSERGASLVEYALLVALIAVVCIIAVQTLGGAANDSFTQVGNEIDATNNQNAN